MQLLLHYATLNSVPVIKTPSDLLNFAAQTAAGEDFDALVGKAACTGHLTVIAGGDPGRLPLALGLLRAGFEDQGLALSKHPGEVRRGR